MWSLYENNILLKPLVFSNGKSQEDVVNEVIDAIKDNNKIIFIRGGCGTGKSAIALNIAKEIGRASIVVPIKSLQKQYENDYTNKKYLIKNGRRLKISILTGRQNFECRFLKEKGNLREEEKEKKLDDFCNLLNKKRAEREMIMEGEDYSCDNPMLPCKIEIKEKNIKRIMKYLKMNKKIKMRDFEDIRKIKRMSIAPVCPYWSPIVPAEIDLNLESNPEIYKGLEERKYKIYWRKKGCGYYDQFESYINSDIIVFNSQKYKLETLMNRKPETDIEIIDECDEFLDSFANTKKISINKLLLSLINLYSDNEKIMNIIDEIIELAKEIQKEKINEDKIFQLKETKAFQLLKYFLEFNFMDSVECDEENYCYHCDEVARTFENFLDETYVLFHREDKETIIKFVTVNLEKRFKELLNKSKVIVMMSGTIHSENVLRKVFGLKDFKIIDAETKLPGKIYYQKTGLEMNCSYESLKKDGAREKYLRALAKCIQIAKKPALVHVISFKDLPSDYEAIQYGLDIMTHEKLNKLQKDFDKNIRDFKEKRCDILYSTKCNRGMDFPGDMCNSIILTRYPFPNINSIFWKILKKTKPEYYHDFYMDKAKREFLQRIYRGLRSENDYVYLLSPDIRVFKTA